MLEQDGRQIRVESARHASLAQAKGRLDETPQRLHNPGSMAIHHRGCAHQTAQLVPGDVRLKEHQLRALKEKVSLPAKKGAHGEANLIRRRLPTKRQDQ